MWVIMSPTLKPALQPRLPFSIVVRARPVGYSEEFTPTLPTLTLEKAWNGLCLACSVLFGEEAGLEKTLDGGLEESRRRFLSQAEQLDEPTSEKARGVEAVEEAGETMGGVMVVERFTGSLLSFQSPIFMSPLSNK